MSLNEQGPQTLVQRLADLAWTFQLRGCFAEASEVLDLVTACSLTSGCSLTSSLTPTAEQQRLLSWFAQRQFARVLTQLALAGVASADGANASTNSERSLYVHAAMQQLFVARVLGEEEEGEAPTAAIADLRAALEMATATTGCDSVCHYLFGLAYEALEDAELATGHFRRAVELEPWNIPARARVGASYPDSGLEGVPWLALYVQAVTSMGGSPREARLAACRQALLGGGPLGSESLVRKLQVTFATLLFEAGQYDEAVLIFERLQYTADPSGAEIYAQLLWRSRNVPVLSKLAADLNKHNRLSVAALFVSAISLIVDGKKDVAAVNLIKVTKLNPKFTDAWLLLAQVQVELRNIPAAVLAYGKVGVADARACKGLAAVYDVLGQKTFADYYRSRA